MGDQIVIAERRKPREDMKGLQKRLAAVERYRALGLPIPAG